MTQSLRDRLAEEWVGKCCDDRYEIRAFTSKFNLHKLYLYGEKRAFQAGWDAAEKALRESKEFLELKEKAWKYDDLCK
jgi:hypothetical protein